MPIFSFNKRLDSNSKKEESMTEIELTEILRKYIIKNESCFSKEVQRTLLAYKKSGGYQNTAKRVVEKLASEFSTNEEFQDKAYDILDIITNWCHQEMKVWD